MATRRVPGALRYAKLEDWDCPTALYLVEKGSPPGTWLIARPALVKTQEWPDAREVVIPEADGEVIVYEKVLLSGDQPGVMPTKSTFNHLEEVEDPNNPPPTPYTLAVLLANCPEDLRLKPEEFAMSPNGGSARMEVPACHRPRILGSEIFRQPTRRSRSSRLSKACRTS